MVALQDRTWTRSRELELKDAVSILQVEPERLGNMWDAYDLLKEASKQKFERLNTQIELFEAERTQLVESAFKSEKEAKKSESKYIEMEAQRNHLRELLSKESELKNKYFIAQKDIMFYQVISVVALLAVLVLTVAVFR